MLLDLILAGELRCPECQRVFDFSNATDAGDYALGHDCEEN
jgi:hypothetical protein